jgi:hypothetical protein
MMRKVWIINEYMGKDWSANIIMDRNMNLYNMIMGENVYNIIDKK